MASVEFLTARGQLAYGAYYLHLHGWERIAAYSAVQGSLLATAGLAAWAALVGDRYFMHRIWTAILLLGSAGVAYLGAKAAGMATAGAISTGALAVSGAEDLARDPAPRHADHARRDGPPVPARLHR